MNLRKMIETIRAYRAGVPLGDVVVLKMDALSAPPESTLRRLERVRDYAPEQDLPALRALAPGTLGREYARFLDANGIEPLVISAAVKERFRDNPYALYLSGGLALPLLFFLRMNLSDIGSDTHLATFARELFPTSYRSTASGALAVMATLGGSLGLAAESLLFAALGSHSSRSRCHGRRGMREVQYVPSSMHASAGGCPQRTTSRDKRDGTFRRGPASS